MEWTTCADDYILEFFEESDIVAPHVVAANIDYCRQYVNRRIRELADHNLVETPATVSTESPTAVATISPANSQLKTTLAELATDRKAFRGSLSS